MTKKQRQSKKAKKSSKRSEVAAEPEDEIDTDGMSASTEVSQATLSIPDAGIAVESQQAAATAAPANPATPATPSNPTTRSEAAKRRRQISRRDCGCIKSRAALPRRNLFSFSVRRATL
jgi:hypothetical protein